MIADSVESSLRAQRFNTDEGFLADWIIYICRVGTERKINPAISTVKSYIGTVINVLIKANVKVVAPLPSHEGDSNEDERIDRLRQYFLQFKGDTDWVENRIDGFARYINRFYDAGFPVKEAWTNSSRSVKTPRTNTITCQEFQLLIDNLLDRELVLFVLFAVGGLRLEEACGLTVQDIQFDKQRGDTNVLVQANQYRKIKNNDSRIVKIGNTSSRFESVLTNLLDRARRRNMKQNSVLLIGDGQQQVRAIHQSLIFKLRSLTGDFTLTAHSLRHFALNQIDLVEARDRAGHSDIRTTLFHYRHRNPLTHLQCIDLSNREILARIERKSLGVLSEFLDVKLATLQKRVYREPSSGLHETFAKHHNLAAVYPETTSSTTSYSPLDYCETSSAPEYDLLDAYIELCDLKRLTETRAYLVTPNLVSKAFEKPKTSELKIIADFVSQRPNILSLSEHTEMVVSVNEGTIVFPSKYIAQGFTEQAMNVLGAILTLRADGRYVNFTGHCDGIKSRRGALRILLSFFLLCEKVSSNIPLEPV